MEKNNNTAAADSLPENSSSSAAEDQEESGWTDYLEDCNFSSESCNYLCSSIGSRSNYNWDHNNFSDPNYDINNIGKVNNFDDDVPNYNLCLKKTTTQKIVFEDDSLQDTATSPIHIPKVVDLNVRTSHENTRFHDHITIITNSTGRGRQLGKYYSNKENDVYSAEKKGLCLFPLSMLLNYHN